MHLVQVGSLDQLLTIVEDLTAADKARISQRSLSGLAWVGKRTNTAIASLAVARRLCEACTGSAGSISMVAALSDIARLRDLRRFDLSPNIMCAHATSCMVGLLDWVLEQMPKVEVMSLELRTGHLPSSHTIFQHVRHLVMTSWGCQEHFLVAKQLPYLETLFIEGNYSDKLEVVDMSGCRRLRQVAVYDIVAGKLIWDTTGSGPCPLAFQLGEPFEDANNHWPEALKSQAALAQQVDLWGRSNIDNCVHGMFGAFSGMARPLQARGAG